MPPVVKNLIIINSLFFLATISLIKYNIDLTSILGLHYPGASDFKLYQFITYMFMHGGWDHILFNMFALWMFGGVIENVWGGKKFLIFYILTGMGSAAVYIVWIHFTLAPNLNLLNEIIANPTAQAIQVYFQEFGFHLNPYVSSISQHDIDMFNRNVTSLELHTASHQTIQQIILFLSEYKAEMLNQMVIIGASGAIFGLLLAFGVMFPDSLIYVYFAIPVKAKWFVLGYGLLELFSGIRNNAGDNVAHFAHVGGMLVGFLIIMYWKKQGKLFNFKV